MLALRRVARASFVARVPCRAAVLSTVQRPEAASPAPAQPPPDPQPPRGILGRAVTRVNDAFEQHPVLSVVALVGTDIVTIFGTHALIKATGMPITAEFAAAFALNRGLRRLRLPLDLAATVALARVAPIFTRIQVLRLTKALSTALPRPSSAMGAKVVDNVRVFMDKYGMTYFVASRLSGAAVTTALYVLLSVGVDMEGWLAAHGFAAIGGTLGTWAAAVTASSLVYPAALFSIGWAVPGMAAVVRLGRRV